MTSYGSLCFSSALDLARVIYVSLSLEMQKNLQQEAGIIEND